MEIRFILLFCIGSGIVWFVLSVAFRRRSKLRQLFITLGIVLGLIPLLLYFAMSLFMFIKERPFVGNYEGDTGVQGSASLDVFDDNTFTLRSDSCASGFIQGTWAYDLTDKNIHFTSTSQRMGETIHTNSDTIVIKNIPICIKLVREIKMVRSGKPLVVPMEKMEF
ncbi:MAG: hypothetical protein ACI8SE_002089 [Bacteroidia bacterium]|jgi:hypothetical protein